MTRFEDRTTNWFEKGDDPQTLASVDLIEVQPRRPLWPIILGSVAGATALAACAFVLIGRRVPQPSPVAAAPATHTPCGVSAPPVEVPTASASAEAPPAADPAIDATASNEAAALATSEATPSTSSEKHAKKPTRVASRVHGKARLAPKAPRAKSVSPEVANGERLLARGQNGAALEHFQRELARNPKDTRALRGACSALGRMGRVNDAARVCRHELALQPDDVETRSQLATLYYEGGAYQWSANEWKRVLASRPHDPQARHGLKQAQARL